MTGASTTQRVVLLFGSGIDAERSAALSSESSELSLLIAGTAGVTDVRVVSLGMSRTISGTSEHVRLDAFQRSFPDRVLMTIGAFALRNRLAGLPIGRLLNSLGPVDPSRVFWRAVKRHPRSIQLLKSADVVIAADLAATKTAWLAVHRGWVDKALYDHRSASVGISWQLPPAVSR